MSYLNNRITKLKEVISTLECDLDTIEEKEIRGQKKLKLSLYKEDLRSLMWKKRQART